MSDVVAAHAWRTNAHMLADLFRIMPPPQGEWVDLTYGGKGGWWREPGESIILTLMRRAIGFFALPLPNRLKAT